MEEATPIAVIKGAPLTSFPPDLFIPPDALSVLLESFTGPLDVLLYLIRKQDLDIMDISIAIITDQYMVYINLLEKHRMELAADYLVMAAQLAEMKSRLLLPHHPELDEQDADPRMELIRRLQQYEHFKTAALMLDALPRWERDVFLVHLPVREWAVKKAEPEVPLTSLTLAMTHLMKRQQCYLHHQITREGLSVRERMVLILDRLKEESSLEFKSLLELHEGRMGLVVTLLAILELAKTSALQLSQIVFYGPIYLKRHVP